MIVIICKQCGKEFKVKPYRIKERARFCSTKCSGQWQSENIRGANHPQWKGGPVIRICKQCGKEFEAKRSKVKAGEAKFCSRDCRIQEMIGEKHPAWKGGPITQTCNQCGKEFEAKRARIKTGGGKFCSLRCSHLSKVTSIQMPCKQCDTEFWTIPSQIEAGKGKFCSKDCFSQWLSENIRGAKHSQWKGGNRERTCEQCGKQFGIDCPSHTRRFCSQSCSNQWRADNIRGEHHPNWTGGKVSQTCMQCEKDFERYPSDIKISGTVLCSKKCFAQWQSENRRGEHAANWQGGKSFETYGLEWTEGLRRTVRKRDNHTCAICGRSGKDVHHIDGDKTNNDPENLITLDRPCHIKTNYNREHWQSILSPIAIARMEDN